MNEPAQPSAACYRAQSLSEAFPTKAEYRPSVSCELAIQKSQDYSNQQNLAVEVLVAFIPFGILGSYMLLKWLVPYCVAVEAATQKRLNASNAALGLMWAGSYGLPALQAAYNNPSAIPEFASHDQTAHLRTSANAYTNKLEHSWLKPALTVMAAAMVIGCVLLIAALVAVTHIG